jgi:putative chitinase
LITAKQLKTAFPLCRDPALWANELSKAAVKYEINTKQRFAMWVAQCAHESAYFNQLRENLSYNARMLRDTWPKRFPSDEFANTYARQPQKLANYVYANRLGNGDVASNDGWNYRGGGVIQLTGKANYIAAEKATGFPVGSFPSRIEHPQIAATVAAWFWQSHGLNEVADTGDFAKVTETINGPAKLHHAQRLANLTKLQAVMA